jgi:hypothetical protein
MLILIRITSRKAVYLYLVKNANLILANRLVYALNKVVKTLRENN